MGAWVDDRLAEEEEVVPIKKQNQQGPSTTRTCRLLGRVCDGGGVGTGQLRPGIIFAPYVASASALLLPLRRQFSRQLYEWPCIPLFKSRTKLDNLF
ncbi:hypothetical protein KPH14_004279 [Odynerus spinipes]|uniref:Uncharacterized protein n=1 Tax=Odynerus spinipes TaxID=1348599 RepID=A0AAD9RYF7_9HYME|nr:hypothetical protein KPH14_004279 [Odynerus spinipes]